MSVQGGRREKGRRLPPPGVASLSSRASARDVSDGVEAADRWAERGRAAQGPLGPGGREFRISLSPCPGCLGWRWPLGPEGTWARQEALTVVQLSAWPAVRGCCVPAPRHCRRLPRASPGRELPHRAARAQPGGLPGWACGSFGYHPFRRDRRWSVAAVRGCTALWWSGCERGRAASPLLSSPDCLHLAKPRLSSRESRPPPSPRERHGASVSEPDARAPPVSEVTRPLSCVRPPPLGRVRAVLCGPFSPWSWVHPRPAGKRMDLRPQPLVLGLGTQWRPPASGGACPHAWHGAAPTQVATLVPVAPGRGVKQFAQVTQRVPAFPPLPLPGHQTDFPGSPLPLAEKTATCRVSRRSRVWWKTRPLLGRPERLADQREVEPGKTGWWACDAQGVSVAWPPLPPRGTL